MRTLTSPDFVRVNPTEGVPLREHVETFERAVNLLNAIISGSRTWEAWLDTLPFAVAKHVEKYVLGLLAMRRGA